MSQPGCYFAALEEWLKVIPGAQIIWTFDYRVPLEKPCNLTKIENNKIGF